MSFAYDTVTIGSGTTYPVYANLSDASTYLLASITDEAAAFRAADADTQGRSLVSATRWLDEADWLGSKADDTQALDWPRSDIEGVDSTSIPAALVAATAELAAYLVADPSFRTTMKAPLARRLRAGSADIDFFRPTEVFISTLFPPNVMSLIKQWLGGSSPSSSVVTDGTCGKSKLDDDLGFNHGF